MYTIGEISRIVNISTDTLRYYDEIDLLKPVSIDANNKYRYYSDEQIKDVLLIMELKQYCFSLDEIKRLLTISNTEEFKKVLLSKLNELGLELNNIKRIIENLHKRILKLNEDSEVNMAGKSVLIVDDVYLVRLLIRNIIEKYGYYIVGEATNGLEACEMYLKLKPDFVIMDITMPVMDGIYATLKIHEKDKDARIIICSAMCLAILAIESLKAGVSDFICKPFSEIRLIEGLEKAISNGPCYDIQYLSDLSTLINNEHLGSLDEHKLLNQKEMDELLTLVENKSENFDVKCFTDGMAPFLKSDDHWSSLRESDAGEPILKELSEIFGELSKNFASYIYDKIGFSYSMKLLSVEQTINDDIRNITATTVGILKIKDKNLPVSIIFYQNIPENVLVNIINYIAGGLKPFLSDCITNSILTGDEYFNSHDTAYAQINIIFELLSPENKKLVLSINIPHEIAKTDDFTYRVLHWKLNKL